MLEVIHELQKKTWSSGLWKVMTGLNASDAPVKNPPRPLITDIQTWAEKKQWQRRPGRMGRHTKLHLKSNLLCFLMSCVTFFPECKQPHCHAACRPCHLGWVCQRWRKKTLQRRAVADADGAIVVLLSDRLRSGSRSASTGCR